ncbi:MAG: hypothetical protein WC979_05080 [Candidatus Pacearchaeota archaeon]|jgi:hypothetical protein
MDKIKKRQDIWQLTAYFAIIIIIISLFVVGIKLTGHVVNSVINVSIEQRAYINFTFDEINFGPGSITPGNSNATIDTLGNVINGNWTPVFEGFTVENLGNVNVSLDLKTNQNAASFLGGQNPSYLYNVTNFESGSCIFGTINFGEWYDVNTTEDGTRICSIFQPSDSQDTIRVDVRLVIPADASLGIKSDIFTAIGTAV